MEYESGMGCDRFWTGNGVSVHASRLVAAWQLLLGTMEACRSQVNPLTDVTPSRQP